LYTLLVKNGNARYGVICNDFKLKGGSFGKQNTRRLVAFLEELDSHKLPLIFVLDSMGARITEGRQVFGYAFAVLPVLMRFARQNLLITCNAGRALGIGAIIFGAGHYRMAVRSSLSHVGRPLLCVLGPM
jgi:acetyl-CoA carboxylase carboxyltransferase component